MKHGRGGDEMANQKVENVTLEHNLHPYQDDDGYPFATTDSCTR